jgi:hypothetical protein
MKPYGWLLLVASLAAVLVLLFVSRAEYNDLESDIAGLQDDLTSLQVEYNSALAELAGIKQFYPPRNFSSEEELLEWLAANDVSDMPIPSLADVEARYALALKIQKDALADGYIISADFDYPIYVYCVAIIDGYFWVWEPESDDAFLYQGLNQIQ